ncbi:MAG: ECF transporter S component [Actinobacteria bacterium]|nr:ECF transporter S component [Actinomycetota bacterium]
MPRAVLLAAAAAAFAAGAWSALSPEGSALSLLLVSAALVVAGAVWFEAAPGRTSELALIATLGAAAAAGRVLFAAIPGVQPVTVVAVAAGVALGARSGFAVGALAALLSNVFLGQGPWTPWQMLLWGGCGVVGALAAPIGRRRVPFALLCLVLGFAFSVSMDLWEWWSFFPHTWASLSVLVARGFWFDVSHAAGNLAIALVAGPELRRLLERYGRRVRAEVVWA